MPTLEALAREFAARYQAPKDHPNGGASTWDQWCGALASRFCLAYGNEPTGDVRSAWRVWKRTPTAGTDPSKAPIGSFHFWDIGGIENGHVGVDLQGGGHTVFMATKALRESWGIALGINSVAGYTNTKSATYVGWTHTYADGDVTRFEIPPAVPMPAPSAGGAVGPVIRSGADWAWREPTGALAGRVQRALKAKGRYAGVVDEAFGPLTRQGVQLTLKISGVFVGAIDGVPERGAAYGIQQYGAKYGDYTKRGGVIDGRPEVLSWDAFALGLERP